MKPPEFLRVLPADVGRVGALGACILALIRYMTALPGEASGRALIEEQTWWCASQDDIGQLLGELDRKAAGRAICKLQSTGDLLAKPAERFYGDRAKVYRVPDQPLPESGQGSDQPLPESGPPSAQEWASSWPESGQAAGPKVGNLPIPVEPKEHSVGKNARKRGTRLAPEWIPPRDLIDQMRVECPGVDLEAAHRKFIDYWTDQPAAKGLKVSWTGTWKNWMRREAEQRQPRGGGGRSGRSTADERVAQVQALKDHHGGPSSLERGAS
jgi:hypothetical protein